ncbi:oxidoreductase [Planomonospora parontospora subsp. parontospora]|uniref:Oxidoreductase n=2 Tax=Planomonospora parontospora TaxID=58119 RepID=A0AA37BJ93_9ACTN|nr:Fic family protein [Planomonospora parontospora]GGK80303.1 oxidoreductase [Planomonospora parontospora]GII11320.1 oxidoreductase [Planomonospora parontospora subsp. parontospora]
MSDPLAVIAELPGVPEAVADVRKAVDRLYGHRVLRRKSPEVSARSALRGARASAALEGADIPLEAIPETTDPVVQGALRVSAELGGLGRTWRTAPRQVLARLHTLAAAGLTEDLGRPRTAETAPDPLGVGAAPGAEATVARVDGLVGLVTADSKAPALVLAAIVHAELAVLRPFGTADGIVARAAERLTLVEFGLDPKSLAAVELGHLELGPAYGEGLRAYLTGTPEGITAWVRHCAAAVTLGVREATAICEAMQRG